MSLAAELERALHYPLADQLPAQTTRRRKLALIGAGASKHGITTTMEQALAEGFGRDPA